MCTESGNVALPILYLNLPLPSTVIFLLLSQSDVTKKTILNYNMVTKKEADFSGPTI